MTTPRPDQEGLEETAELLSDDAALAAIEAGRAEVERGETVTLDELGADLARRRGD